MERSAGREAEESNAGQRRSERETEESNAEQRGAERETEKSNAEQRGAKRDRGKQCRAEGRREREIEVEHVIGAPWVMCDEHSSLVPQCSHYALFHQVGSHHGIHR